MLPWLPTLLCALAAYLTCRALTPWVMRLAPHIGAIDVPRDRRRMHTRPIPRTGGLSLFAALLLCAGAVQGGGDRLVALLWGATLVVLLGLLDDVYRLPAPLKLSVQIIAAATALGNGGGWDALPLGATALPLGVWRLPLGALWTVLLINAHNMIDGLDGLAASVSVLEAAGLSVLLMLQGQDVFSMLSLALAGACLGFLHDNRHPASVFMGDTGSQLLGFSLGVLSQMLEPQPLGTLAALVPLLLFALPLSDLGFAVLRRLWRGQSPFAADRGHWHHRLVDGGMSQRQSCTWLTLLCAVSVAAALLVGREETYPYAVYTLLVAVSLVMLLDTLRQKVRG